MDTFDIVIPENLQFQDYLAIVHTARIWADGYDLKSYPRLIATLAPQVTIDYTGVNPAWGQKTYEKEAFAKLWMSEEHLGHPLLRTQHLLGLPYFYYVGPRRTEKPETNGSVTAESDGMSAMQEIEVSWQIMASHGRQAAPKSSDGDHPSTISETSDHRAFMTHVFIKVDGQNLRNTRPSQWKLASIKPEPIYMEGDFERIRRPANVP